jgi:hypothetical protein
MYLKWNLQVFENCKLCTFTALHRQSLIDNGPEHSHTLQEGWRHSTTTKMRPFHK